jgi:hypothetical protein
MEDQRSNASRGIIFGSALQLSDTLGRTQPSNRLNRVPISRYTLRYTSILPYDFIASHSVKPVFTNIYLKKEPLK